jgi:hypothetical protein
VEGKEEVGLMEPWRSSARSPLLLVEGKYFCSRGQYGKISQQIEQEDDLLYYC